MLLNEITIAVLRSFVAMLQKYGLLKKWAVHNDNMVCEENKAFLLCIFCFKSF